MRQKGKTKAGVGIQLVGCMLSEQKPGVQSPALPEAGTVACLSPQHSRGVGRGRGLSFTVLLSSTGRSLRLAWAMACLLEGELRREGSGNEEKEENA